MKNYRLISPLILAMVILGGCEQDDSRLVRMTEQNLARQAEQNRENAKLQQELAAGARELIAADTQSRQELIGLQHELHEQHTQLEDERKQLALMRQRDPIIAESITQTGFLAACLLPLVLCWLLLRQPPVQADDREIVELLMGDLESSQPQLWNGLHGPDLRLLPTTGTSPRLGRENLPAGEESGDAEETG